ncbi:LytR/AlgR family response regulator transcription factor [Mucilaginibacter sp. SP1R1]|uniref:LytR/AlgR family response regulator transcription factor n=1 Tax=Mucilaginibacter sp. SP1R1 TaxID=2723091 RepID=UPI0016156CDD|nr:LytTR family DNA-binding domain-containing protein [Mucilaginibacter sp. SP1R1]MBB6148031.1 DNA-binding LytR/AlgR family response regulator [Mucilaginibacter sp. SP1R1]
MNIVIIEDEQIVSDNLEINIRELTGKPLNIVKLLSVKESISYFGENPPIDLIISDIQLGDGLSFEIFMAVPVKAPVIFCTAYDEYALEAFRANGIDYILKPFTRQMLQQALQKFDDLTKKYAADPFTQYGELWKAITERDNRTAVTILVYHQDKIIPIKIGDVALFYLENEISHLLTFSGKIYFPNKTLDDLEKLSGNNFFRANRQFLVCRSAIVDVSSFFSRKLSLNLNAPLPEKVIVSKGKASQFLTWLAGN